jgi:hypothetical protein
VRIRHLIVFLLMVFQSVAWAQQQGSQQPPAEGEAGNPRRGLLDDSTKMVYGPRTSLYFLEKHLRYNRFEQFEIDTALNNFHNYEPVAKTGYKYQDLGNLGSAAKAVFYQVPKQIGRTSGFHVYDIYYHSPDSLKYYNTKSPHTNLAAYFGGGNRNKLDVTFTRNVTPKWNVGFNFRTIRSTKVLNLTRRDDHLAEQNHYDIHTNYQSENEKYFLLANFTRMRHLVNEQGGIIPPTVDTTSSYFTYKDAKVWLRNSRAVDLRQDYHVYHQYELLKGWQIYHVFDRKKQLVTFFSDLSSPDALFFNENRFNFPDTTNIDLPDSMNITNNHNHFSEWRNEIGFKGDFGPVYYNAFVKFRTGRMASNFFDSDNSFNELYLGGALRGEINEAWSFEAEGEYLIPEGYRLQGLFISPFLEVSYTKASYRPTMAQQRYRGNHYRWDNNFSNTGVDQIRGEIKADFKSFSLRPSLTINRVNNHVYYNDSVIPQQAAGQALMVIPGFKSHVQLGRKFHWQSEGYYTLITGGAADVFRVPELFINSKFYFDGPLFNEAIYVQIGLEGRYRSDYYADAYMPATQQFYLQDEFNVFAYPVVDAFFNFRIKRTRVMFRYNHANSYAMRQPGYFVTPYFTGLNSMLDVGINWSFFD